MARWCDVIFSLIVLIQRCECVTGPMCADCGSMNEWRRKWFDLKWSKDYSVYVHYNEWPSATLIKLWLCFYGE